jgi:pimeloyl-ACP methyl ester carboxylesterase
VSFPGRLIDTSAGRVFIHQDGSGPPLVLVHGMFVSHWYFRPVIAELRRHFRVTAIDLPGFGESDRPPLERYRYDAASAAALVDEIMEALDIPAATLVSHSMGGGVALALAAHHPARVTRLVLEDAWVYPIEMPLLGRLALQPMLGSMLFKHLYSRRDLVRHFRGVFRDPALVTGELVDYYWERFNRAGAREAGLAALRAFASMLADPVEPARVRVPTLIVWGEEDRLFPLAHGRRLAREIPGAKLVIIPVCGHSPHEERPDEYLRAVIPFLLGRDESAAAHNLMHEAATLG